jgi:hypothetical protein
MNRIPHPSYRFHSNAARRSLFGALEWEGLPSQAPSLNRQSLAFAGTECPATQRMELFEFEAPAPFAEPIHGLHVREIDGADVFSHFFGRSDFSH